MTTFAVRRRDIRQRANVKYAAASRTISDLHGRVRYPLVALRELTTVVQYGTSEAANTDGTGLPIVRMNNLQDEHWDFSDTKHIDLDPADRARYRLQRGDILFNRTNSEELVGKCLVFDEPDHWVFASYLIRVRMNTDRVLPQFVVAFLNTPAGRAQIDRVSRPIIGMSNINAEELRDLLIPLPSDLAVQRQLVDAWHRANHQRRQDADEARRILHNVDALVVAALGLPMPAPIDRTAYGVRLHAVRSEQRLNPEYFHPERRAALAALRTLQPPIRLCELSQIADFIREGIRVAGGGYLGLAQVESNTGELTTDQPSEDEAGLSFTFQVDDVLFARLRPYLNKVHRAERAGLCSTEFHVIRIRPADRRADAISPDYLAMVLRSSVTLAQTRHMMTGNTHPRLTNDDVTRLQVPIPPPDVQARLVQQLHERRQQARAMLGAADVSWQEAKQAFQAALFENPA